MVKEDPVPGLHLFQIVARLEISDASPISAAVANEIIPRITLRLLLYHPYPRRAISLAGSFLFWNFFFRSHLSLYLLYFSRYNFAVVQSQSIGIETRWPNSKRVTKRRTSQ